MQVLHTKKYGIYVEIVKCINMKNDVVKANTFMPLDIAVAFATRGQTPYSANKPSKDVMNIYLSSSVT